jgi:hypothetical protein
VCVQRCSFKCRPVLPMYSHQPLLAALMAENRPSLACRHCTLAPIVSITLLCAYRRPCSGENHSCVLHVCIQLLAHVVIIMFSRCLCYLFSAKQSASACSNNIIQVEQEHACSWWHACAWRFWTH